MKKLKTENELNKGIAALIQAEWPKIPTQDKMAKKLRVAQSKISKTMAKWTKNNVKLEVQYKERERLEGQISKKYGVETVSVFPFTKYYSHTKTYFDQLGAYSADIIIERLNKKIDENINDQERALSIRITSGCGRSVSACLMCLVEEVQDSKIELALLGCNALRSNSLVGLSPLHIVAHLLGMKSNIIVNKAFQLPEFSADPELPFEEIKEDLYEIVDQRIKAQLRFKFDDSYFNSDFAILGLGSMNYKNPSMVGFEEHISHVGAQDLMEKLGIKGEVAYSPFNENGFLFPKLRQNVFKYSTAKKLSNINKNTIVNWLKEYAVEDVNQITEKHAIDTINLYSSIFTLDFSELEEKIKKRKNKRPFVFLLVGGDKHKALALKTLLKLWNGTEMLNGLIVGENIAEEM